MTPPHHQATGQPDYRLGELPRRYIRHLDADQIARLLDGFDPQAEPEVVRRQREFKQPRPNRLLTLLTAFAVSMLIYALIVGAMVLL